MEAVKEKKGTLLLDLLNENENLFNSTGRYFGLERLELRETDPIKYEVFYTRLLGGTIVARESARQVAASPIVREVAELCTVLLTPDGDSVAYSTGIVVHTQCMGRVVKWMIRNGYEENPGIKEGDIFECNDMLLGGVHIPDVYTIVPIFHEERLVGWVGTVSHEPDVGAVTGGCVPALATERFMEGIKFTAERVGENDTFDKTYEVRVNSSVRLPHIWLLDAKARATCSITLRQAVMKVIEEFGMDYYEKAIRELIEEERMAQLERVKKRLVPGRYREAGFVDILQADLPVLPWARNDMLLAYPLEVQIGLDGLLTIDANGGSSWGYHSFNVPPGAIEGGISIGMNQVIAYDGKVNSGFMLGTKLILPEGTWCNPNYRFCATANSWNVLMEFLELFRKLISQGYFARGFREEVMAGSGGISFIEAGGNNQFGQLFGGPIPEAASGGGGRAVGDGLDSGHVFWNPEADTGNAEVWELIYPFVYVGRNSLPDSGGFGKFRGGNGHESYYMVWGTDFVYMSEIPMMPHNKILFNGGLFGGYPGMHFTDFLATNTNMKERIEKQLPIPHREGDPRNPDVFKLLKGDIKPIPHFYITDPLKDYDLIAHRVISGCGGYGDPIERDPALIKKDLANGLTSPETVTKINAVALAKDNGTWHVKEQETTELRASVRENRKKRGRPVKEWWQTTRQRILKGDLDPHVIELHRDCLKNSEKFKQEFQEFWALPGDFSFEKEVSK
jgi:acetone carboxylase alpha subunit